MSRTQKIVLLIESSRASGRALLNGVANYAHYRGPWSFYWDSGGLESAWPVLKSLDQDGIIMRDGDRLNATALINGLPNNNGGNPANKLIVLGEVAHSIASNFVDTVTGPWMSEISRFYRVKTYEP